MTHRRTTIIEAGLKTLREHGYSGFTQNRVAALAELRQSHLTYYHPTRLDLLTAVGEAAVAQQFAAIDAALGKLTSLDEAAGAIASLVTRHENTRVLMALAQAGDEEPRLRLLFCRLADGIVERVSALFERCGYPGAGLEHARCLHALSVGLAVVDLATGRSGGKQRAADILKLIMPPRESVPNVHPDKRTGARPSTGAADG